jgi:hypothetical protein
VSNGVHHHLVFADYINMLGANTNDIKNIEKNPEAWLETSREFGVEANTEKTK